MTFPNSQSNPAGAIPVYSTGGGAQMLTDAVGAAIAAGGVSEAIAVAFDVNSRYLIIQNPPDTASQGVTAENLYVALFGDAVLNGVLNYAVLAPGQCCAVGFADLRPNIAMTVNVIAATTGHKYLATHFYVGE